MSVKIKNVNDLESKQWTPYFLKVTFEKFHYDLPHNESYYDMSHMREYLAKL